MNISQTEWSIFKDMLSAINSKAVEEMAKWLESKGGVKRVSFQEMSAYAYALATKYGEASASLSAQMYDEIADLSGMTLPSAEVADTVSYSEIAKAITKTAAKTQNTKNVSEVVGRYVKRTGADTMLKNAQRDGAQFAWVPAGDSCAFCITLASRGWQFMSKNALRNGHAEHIHTNCDCTYAVRFDNKTNIKGYDPQVYKDMYYGAEGNTPQEKINSMRRIQYQANKDKINIENNGSTLSQHKKGNKVFITEQAIDKVKAIGPSDSSSLEKKLMQEMNKQILKESQINNNSNEVAMALIGGKMSKVVLGTQNSVSIFSDPEMFHIIKGKDIEFRSVILSHNHPGLSYFSADDVKVFVDNPTIKTLEIVTNTGRTWFISKKDDYNDSEMFDLFYNVVRENRDDPRKAVDIFLKKAHNMIEYNK